MSSFELKIRTAVRGYHVYQDIWTPVLDEQFNCQQDTDNEHDRYAVKITRTTEDEVHGHLPREISKVSYFFLAHDGTIMGKVTSTRRYCKERGGMEIPCELAYCRKRKHIRKLKKYFEEQQLSCIEIID